MSLAIMRTNLASVQAIEDTVMKFVSALADFP